MTGRGLRVPTLVTTYGSPAVVAAVEDVWPRSLHQRCSAIHHKYIRTTSLLERAFLEQRRRTRAILRFFDERSRLKLVFTTLWQASERWQTVHMSEFERQQLDHLRRELGLRTTEPVTLTVSLEAAA